MTHISRNHQFFKWTPLNPSNINASHCYSPTETLCNSQASNEKALLTPVIPRGARLSTKAKQYFYGTKVSFLKIWNFFGKHGILLWAKDIICRTGFYVLSFSLLCKGAEKDMDSWGKLCESLVLHFPVSDLRLLLMLFMAFSELAHEVQCRLCCEIVVGATLLIRHWHGVLL